MDSVTVCGADPNNYHCLLSYVCMCVATLRQSPNLLILTVNSYTDSVNTVITIYIIIIHTNYSTASISVKTEFL